MVERKINKKSSDKLSDMEISVLKVMHSRGIYGKHHKRIETIQHSGFPSHLTGDVKKAIKNLIKKGFIILVKKDVGAVTLNFKKHKEIKKIIEESF